MSESRVKNSLFNITSGLFGQVLIIVFGFAVRTVFIYCLGKTYLGVSGLFSNILSILSFAELGIGQAIVFSLYKPIADHDEEMIQSLMHLFEKVYRILFLVVLCLGLSVLPFLKYIINDYDRIPNLDLIYVMYVINSAATYLFIYKSTFLIANQRNYIVNYVSYVVNFSVSVIQIVTLIIFNNYILYLTIQIAFNVLQNIYVAAKVNRMYPFLMVKDIKPLPKQEMLKIKKNVGALVIYKVGTLSLNSTDNIIISKYVGLIAVGLYSNYLLIATSVSGCLASIFGNITASVGNLNAKESDEKKYFIFKVINLATFWLYSYVAICIFIMSNPFIGSCWLGEGFLLDWKCVLIISLNIYIAGMLYAPFQYRQTMGLFVQGKWRPIVSAVENVVLSIVFGYYFGLAGVLWGTAVTRLTTNGWYDPYIVFRKLGLSPLKYYADYIFKVFIMIGVGMLCMFLTSLYEINDFMSLLLTGIMLTVVINLLYIAIFYRTGEFKYLKDVSLLIFRKIKDKTICRLSRSV